MRARPWPLRATSGADTAHRATWLTVANNKTPNCYKFALNAACAKQYRTRHLPYSKKAASFSNETIPLSYIGTRCDTGSGLLGASSISAPCHEGVPSAVGATCPEPRGNTAPVMEEVPLAPGASSVCLPAKKTRRRAPRSAKPEMWSSALWSPRRPQRKQ